MQSAVHMLCAKIALMATVFKNVDFPEAFEPVSSIGPVVSMSFGTAYSKSGWTNPLPIMHARAS